MTDPISIKVSLWDSGCLPSLLQTRISEVERQIRVTQGAAITTPDATDYAKQYLAQLRACLAAVEKARST